MSIYRTFEKACPDCGGGRISGEGTGIRPGSEERGAPETCATCDGTGVINSRSSQMAIKKAREKREER